jgi:hypothetical protein
MADKITDLLARRVQPATTAELPQAIGGAILKRTTFGDALNELRAQNLAQKKVEQNMSLDERNTALAEKEFDFKTMKFLQDYKHDDAKAFEASFKTFSEGLPNKGKADLYLYARNHETPVTRQNAGTILAEGIKELDLKPEAKGGQGSVKRIQDNTSRTGWSWINLKTQQKTPDAPPPGGLKARFNPKTGEFEISTGADLTKSTQTGLQKDIVQAEDGLARIREIEAAWDPSFLTYVPRFEAWKTGLQAKSKGIPVLEWIGEQFGEPDRQLARRYAAFMGRSWRMLNEYISDISGAAVSPSEAERLMNALPNPGTGILDGDDPYEFWQKLQDTNRELKKVVARKTYALQNGLPVYGKGSLGLDEIEGLMERRWGEVFDSLPEDDPDREAKATQAIKEEFGIDL